MSNYIDHMRFLEKVRGGRCPAASKYAKYNISGLTASISDGIVVVKYFMTVLQSCNQEGKQFKLNSCSRNLMLCGDATFWPASLKHVMYCHIYCTTMSPNYITNT